MAGYNTTQNRKITSRATISVLALVALVFTGVAAAEQLYVNESGWWQEGGAFNASTAPIQAAVGAATPGDIVFVYNGTYYEDGGVSITKDGITLRGEDANTTMIHGKWTAEKVVYVSGNYVNVSGFTVTGSAFSESGIYAYTDNCVISGNIIYDCGEGVYLSGSDNSIATHNNVSECIYGIFLRSSSNNTLENNTVNSNDYSGIYIVHSNNNTFSNNTVDSNGYLGGVHLWSSSNNTLRSNTVNSNSYGFYLYSSSNNNLITGNSIEANVHGIRLVESTNTGNIIIENTIANNTQHGVYLDYSSDNEIYHNNFINNNKQAYDHHGFNEWDKGSIIGGNHWSDHACHGNPSNGTEPYTGIDTDAGAVDNYPFEEPDGWVTKNRPPIANFTYIPLNPIVNQTVTFNASNSADSDGTITNFEWDFGDGNTTNTTEETVTHFYVSAEDYTVNLTVTDDKGATNSTSKAITVNPPTIIYVPNDYVKIQWAVDNASAGDTIFVWNGSYTENVNVYKQLTLEGEGADVVTVTAASSGDPVFWVTADYMNISGFAVRGATDSDVAGIYLNNADYCNISVNNVYGNSDGIYLDSSSSNTLSNNTMNSNNANGIYMDSSSGNMLENNTASNNYHGIYVDSSSGNMLENNTCSNGGGAGIYLSSSNDNMLENNICLDGWGGIDLRSSSNNTLTNNTVNSNNLLGIYLYNADYNNIVCNRVQNNDYGIYLDNADNNDITCNWVQNNTQRGFYLTDGSTGNTIEHNNIIENGNYNATNGGREWQFYMDQYNPVEAKHNYWGVGMNNGTIDASIYDDEEEGWGEVEFYPFETEPVPCAPTLDNTSGPTYVSGFISTNATWTSVGSPYIVIGDVIVEEGVKLIIDHGVTVKFESEKELIIDGILNANGNKHDRIIFTSANFSASLEDRGSIY